MTVIHAWPIFLACFRSIFAPTVSDQTSLSKVKGNYTISVKINRVKYSIGGYTDGHYGVIYIYPDNVLFYLNQK